MTVADVNTGGLPSANSFISATQLRLYLKPL